MSAPNRKTIEKIVYGDEPVCNAKSYTQTEFITILNWYNYNASHDDLKYYTLDYVETHLPDILLSIVDIPKTLFKGTLGALCRMVTRGYPNSDYITGKINTQLDELINYAGEREQTKTSLPERPKPKPKDTVDTYIDDIEIYVDNCVTTGNFVNKDWKKFIAEKKIKKGDGEIISSYFSKLLGELKESNEGYTFDKKQFGKYVAIVQNIVDTFNNITVVRTQRVRKEKPLDKDKLVKKVKYLPELTELNLKSVSPVDIIGARVVLLYNTKNKKIQLVWGKEDLIVRGSTIFNIDPEISMAKTVRKPYIIGHKFVGRDIPYVLGSFRSLTTTDSVPTGAINEHTLILQTWSVDKIKQVPTQFEF